MYREKVATSAMILLTATNALQKKSSINLG
jgi:hypothetical protein